MTIDGVLAFSGTLELEDGVDSEGKHVVDHPGNESFQQGVRLVY